jgi:archaellum component FlaC
MNILEQKIDTLTELLKGHIEYVSERFEGVDNRLDRMDNRFDGIDSRLDGIEHRMDKVEVWQELADDKFTALAEGMSVLDTKIDRIGETVDKLEAKNYVFDGMILGLQGISKNHESRLIELESKL